MLATREIRRARLRFALLAGAIGLLVYLILFQQVLLGSLLQGFTGAVENQSAPVLVYSAESRNNVEASIIPPPVLEAVAGVDGVAAAAPWAEGTFTVEAAGTDVDASIIGFQPGAPGEPTKLVAGRLPAAVGEAVASKEDKANGFDLGQTVTSTQGDVPLTIVGLTEQSRFSVAPTLFVTFSTYEQLRRAANPDATAVYPSVVAVQPAPGVDPTALATRINEAVPGVDAMTRAQAVADAPGVSSVKSSFNLIFALAFFVVTLVIGFFFLILTVQKLPALTLLRAVGAPSRYLIRNQLLQMVLVVGTGLLVGVGLLYASAGAASAGLPLQVETGTVLTTCATVIVLALLSSLVGVLRVARIDPFSVVNRQSLGGMG